MYYVYVVAYTALEQKHLEFKLLTMAPPTHKFYDLYISAHKKNMHCMYWKSYVALISNNDIIL